MDKVVQASAARAEEGASVAQDLTAQSTALQLSVGELIQPIGGKALSHANTQASSRQPVAVHVERKEPAFANS